MSEDTEKPEGETAEEESADKPQYSKAQPGARRRMRNFIRLSLSPCSLFTVSSSIPIFIELSILPFSVSLFGALLDPQTSCQHDF